MINQKRIQLTKLALALSIALSAAPSFAQNTTSAIGGRISGADGKPAGGATVSIVHVESGSVSNVVTDAEGRYLARGLRTGGPYTIIITKNGVSEKRENVFTNLAETSAVDATVGAPIQQVTVTGSASRSERFSKSTMGTGTAISQTELVTQASIQRNLQDFARTDPRVSQTDKERGEISVAGQNSRYNSQTIDGVAVNDTFGLEANGSPTAKQPISIEAIQSVQVNVANYDVTQKGYTGANINAVTKSGTNTWKGTGYFVFRDDKLSGDRYNASTDTYSNPAPFKETTKGAWVSGPLIKDKLFIFALAEELVSTRTSPEFGPLGSSRTNIGITQSAITGAQQIAQQTYGINIGQDAIPEGVALKVREKLIKLDWNINDEHRAMMRYSNTSQAEPFFPNYSSTGVSLDSHFYSQGKAIETLVGQVFSDWTPSLSTELKYSKRDYTAQPTNGSRMPVVGLSFLGPLPAGSPAGVSTGTRFLNFGTERSRQQNVLGTDTTDLYAGANWSVGDHELKFGVDHNKNTIYNAFLQDVYGNYTFSCQNTTATYTYQFNNGAALNCTNAATTNAMIEAAVLENFRRGRPSAYSVQVPVAGGTLNDAISQFTMKNTGLFVQDTWTVNPRLTVTYGVRLDTSDVENTPKQNTAAAAAPTVLANGRASGGFGLDNRQTIDGQKLVQPRFGFNYKLSQDKNMQLRGGAGLFQGAAASVWLSNPFSNPGVATRVVSCATNSTRCPDAGGLYTPNVDAQVGTLPGTTPAANVDFIDPSLKQPSIWKMNLAFDTELPWYGIVFGAEYLHLKNKDSIYYKQLNLGKATGTAKDGREMYWNTNNATNTTRGGYDPLCFNAAGGTVSSNGCGVSAKDLRNRDYNNVLVATRTDQGKGNLVTLSLSRPMMKGIAWSIAGTKTRATEVSPLTSSTSSSNFSGRSVFNPNEEVASNSSYLVKDRINASFSMQKKFFGNLNTRFGVFAEHRSGKPYSWTINNDLNGDGLNGNDLMYIPSAFGSGEVVFAGDTATSKVNETKFWSIVDANPALKKAAGRVIGRNTDFAPWANSFDMKISQELPGLFSKNKAVFSLDFLNVGNMLNKKWGRIDEVGFQGNGGTARSFVDYGGLDASGKYVYIVRSQVENLNTRQAKGESQWAVQATFKYEF
jgi:hypothetical protein